MENTETPIKSEMELAEEEIKEVLKGLYKNIDEETVERSIKVARDTGRSSGKGELVGLQDASATLKKLAEINKQNSKGERSFTLPPNPSEKK